MANNEKLLLKIRSLIPSLNQALRKIGAYVLENPGDVKTMRIKELAGACGVAEATVTRFVKTIGLASFQDLKISLAEIMTRHEEPPEMVYDEVSSSDSLRSIIDKIFSLNARALDDTIAQMSLLDVLYAGLAVKTFATSVEMIERSARALRDAFMQG